MVGVPAEKLVAQEGTRRIRRKPVLGLLHHIKARKLHRDVTVGRKGILWKTMKRSTLEDPLLLYWGILK